MRLRKYWYSLAVVAALLSSGWEGRIERSAGYGTKELFVAVVLYKYLFL